MLIQSTLFGEAINKGAHLSDDKRYRFTLWRTWDESKPLVMIVGLNPSTADARDDDPTIRKLIAFVKRFGYGGFYMLNLFAFRATWPSVMKMEADPVGFHNDEWLRVISQRVDKVIFAWGCDGSHMGRDKEIIAMFPEAYCFGKTKEGHPKHPLYLAGNTPLIRY